MFGKCWVYGEQRIPKQCLGNDDSAEATNSQTQFGNSQLTHLHSRPGNTRPTRSSRVIILYNTFTNSTFAVKLRCPFILYRLGLIPAICIRHEASGNAAIRLSPSNNRNLTPNIKVQHLGVGCIVWLLSRGDDNDKSIKCVRYFYCSNWELQGGYDHPFIVLKSA